MMTVSSELKSGQPVMERRSLAGQSLRLTSGPMSALVDYPNVS
jgi:hypothetical protein